MPQTILEIPFEEGSIHPVILPEAIGLPINIAPRIPIPISKLLHPFPMLQTGLKLTLILIAINPGVHPIAISHAELPLANIGIAPAATPHARAMLLPADPLALVHFPIGPFESSEAFWLAIDVTARVLRAIREFFEAFAMFEIALPISLIEPATLIDHDPLAMPLAIHELPEIVAVLIPLQLELVGLQQRSHIELAFGLILLEELDELFGVYDVAVRLDQLLRGVVLVVR